MSHEPRLVAATRLCRGSRAPNVDRPADAVLVGECTEDVSPEHLLEWAVLGTARAQVVVDLAELGFVSSDECQREARLRGVGGVAAVAGPQLELAGVEGGIDNETLL